MERESEKIRGNEDELEQLKNHADEMKQKRLDCFKMCFRIKVVDSIDFHTDSQSTAHKQVIISFVMTGQDMYEEL